MTQDMYVYAHKIKFGKFTQKMTKIQRSDAQILNNVYLFKQVYHFSNRISFELNYKLRQG